MGGAWGCEMRCRYYRSLSAVKGDLQLIANNCVLYNEEGSELVVEARELAEAAKRVFEGVKEEEEKAFEPLGETSIQDEVESVVGRMREWLRPVESVLDTPLPPYLVSYSEKL